MASRTRRAPEAMSVLALALSTFMAACAMPPFVQPTVSEDQAVTVALSLSRSVVPPMVIEVRLGRLTDLGLSPRDDDFRDLPPDSWEARRRGPGYLVRLSGMIGRGCD